MTPQPAAPNPQPDDPFRELRQNLQAARNGHRTFDSLLYNGGTAIVLLFTGAAALLPTINPDPHYRLAAQVLAALAAFVVAMERSLNFGSRWRFHLEMSNLYNSLLDMLGFYQGVGQNLPENERQKYLQDIWKELYVVRRREGGIPGSGTGAQS